MDTRLLGLLPKKLEELTDDDFGLLQSVFKFEAPVTEELKKAAMALLRGKDINAVADLIRSPESLRDLAGLLKSRRASQPEGIIQQCPHCRDFFIIRL